MNKYDDRCLNTNFEGKYFQEGKMNILETLTWNEPKTMRRSSNFDVSISRGAPTGNHFGSINITLRNDVHELICPTGGMLQYAYAFNRLFFREGKTGWKLSKGNKSNDATRYVKIYFGKGDTDSIKILDEMIGDYDLVQDEGIYCIRKQEKK